MRAAILREFAGPIATEEVETPVPGPGEVLVKVQACGVCHSDLHLAQGDWDMLRGITKMPLIGGHEIAGVVSAVGEGVSDLKIGRPGWGAVAALDLRRMRVLSRGPGNAVQQTENHGLHGRWRVRGVREGSGVACGADCRML